MVCVNVNADFAHVCAPCISPGAPGRAANSSTRTTRSGSNTAISPAKSPPRNAVKNESTTFRCSESTPWRICVPPCTLRLARLASCRAAVAVRPTIRPISSNDISNRSCNTNASRSAGVNRSSTINRATPTVCEHRFLLRIASSPAHGRWFLGLRLQRVLAMRLARAQHVQAHACDDRGQPPSQILDFICLGTAQSQPGLLDGVVRLAQRTEHAVSHRPQVIAVLFESFRQPVTLSHVQPPSWMSGRISGFHLGHLCPCRFVMVVTNEVRSCDQGDKPSCKQE